MLLLGLAYLPIRMAVAVSRRLERCSHGKRGGRWFSGKCVDCDHDRNLAQQKLREEGEARRKRERLQAEAVKLKNTEAARLLRSLIPSLEELRAISPQQFEDETARMFRRLGYTVEQTPYANDQGRDAIMRKDGKKYLVECKRYGEGTSVGRPDIQKFDSAIKHDRAVSGFFVTTGKFTQAAVEYARNKPIELIDAARLRHYLYQSKHNEVQDDTYLSACLECGATVRHALRDPKNEMCPNGHSVAPTLLNIHDVIAAPPLCERCGTPMRLVPGRNGKFWGCSLYPRCRSTRPYDGPDPRRRRGRRVIKPFSSGDRR